MLGTGVGGSIPWCLVNVNLIDDDARFSAVYR